MRTIAGEPAVELTDIVDSRMLRLVGPTPGARFSDGLVVEASILARLLGIRLLHLEAHIAIVPADLGSTLDHHRPASFTLEPGDQLTGAGDLADATNLLAHASRTLVEAQRDS